MVIYLNKVPYSFWVNRLSIVDKNNKKYILHDLLTIISHDSLIFSLILLPHTHILLEIIKFPLNYNTLFHKQILRINEGFC